MFVCAIQWDATEYTQNTFKFDSGDAIVALAKDMGAKVHCHTLQWVCFAHLERCVVVADMSHLCNRLTAFADSSVASDPEQERDATCSQKHHESYDALQ